MFKKLPKLVRRNADSYIHHSARNSVRPQKFTTLIVLDKPVDIAEIAAGKIYVIAREGRALWAQFRCPCECGDVITLSLQTSHKPHWIVSIELSEPSFYPSIWRDVGCKSHFVVWAGYVYWCNSRGTITNEAKAV